MGTGEGSVLIVPVVTTRHGGNTHVKADVVVKETLSSIDHLHIVELILIHRFKHGNLHLDPSEVEFGSFVRIHAVELSLSSASCM